MFISEKRPIPTSVYIEFPFLKGKHQGNFFVSHNGTCGFVGILRRRIIGTNRLSEAALLCGLERVAVSTSNVTSRLVRVTLCKISALFSALESLSAPAIG